MLGAGWSGSARNHPIAGTVSSLTAATDARGLPGSSLLLSTIRWQVSGYRLCGFAIRGETEDAKSEQ